MADKCVLCTYNIKKAYQGQKYINGEGYLSLQNDL